MIKSTVSSMRPQQLWVEYEKLVKWYKEEGWGIYDDSSDMDRAVVLSDAYYGDMSSLVPVYQQTGKMMMIQNALIYKKQKITKYLRKYGYCFYRYFYLILTDYANAVVEIDKETHFIKNIVYLPEECKIYLSVSFIIADNWLYLAPYSSENFWRINVITKADRED